MKIVDDELPIELRDILNSPEFDDEAGIFIDAVRFNNEVTYLKFSFCYDDAPRQNWKVTIRGTKEECILGEWIQDIGFYKAHPLLLKHNDINTSLYFNGTTIQSQAVFFDIMGSLYNLSDQMADIKAYFFPPERVSELCEQGYGLFAEGSKTILNIYHQCLTRYGIRSYFVGEWLPSDEARSLRLLKLGNSYIIGRSFKFERVT